MPVFMNFGKFLLRLAFDPHGCTDTRIANVGGIRFTTESAIKRDHQRSAYFPPYSHAGLRFKDTAGEIRDLFAIASEEFTIYFYFKIKREYMRKDNITPIITFRDGEANDKTTPFLYILDRKWFVIDVDDSINQRMYSRNMDFMFDGLWHTFMVTRKNHKITFFIDGVKDTQMTQYNPIIFGDNIYIGLHHFGGSEDSGAVTFNGGCIDDFCITNAVNYDKSYVPPVLYWHGYDSLDNYNYNAKYNTNNLDPDIGLQMEKNRDHTVNAIIRNQAGNIPYRMQIEWFVDNKFFVSDEEQIIIRNEKRDYTILRIFLVENIHMFVDGVDRFGEWEAITEVSVKYTMWPFVLFINNCFIPLSRIQIIKSDYWYTFLIRKLSPDTKVFDVKMIFIPFRCIYEEWQGERPDKKILYSFKENGKFSIDGADFYYYLDDERYPTLNCSGLREQIIDPAILDDDPYSEKIIDERLMHYSWRYGEFETKRIDGTSTYVYFMAWDNGWINPGDEVLIYSGNVLIDKDAYRIVGYDLLEFFNYSTLGLSGKLITMCIVTDCRADEWLFQDYTDTKIVKVEATQNDQSVFEIPDTSDGDPIPYDKFLLFKGSICLEDENRYKIDYDKGTVTLLRSNDWMPLGRSLTFVFVRVHKSDAWGPFWIKPIFYYQSYTNSYTATDPLSVIPLPNIHGIKFNMNNIMIYNHNTLIIPQRYRIDNNVLYFMNAGDGLVGTPSLTFVILKMASQIEKDTVKNRMLLDQYKKGKRFLLYDLGINKKIKLTLENITAFDQNGEYISDLNGYIYNMNIIKQLYTTSPKDRVVQTIQVVYHEWSNENYANITLPENENFIKRYLTMTTEFEEVDKHFDEFVSEFEEKNKLFYRPYNRYTYYSNPRIYSYGVNLAREIHYEMYYNQDRFDKVYEHKRTVTRKTFDAKTVNNALVKTGSRYNLTIPQNTKWFINNIYNTYSLFFRQGKLINHKECVSYLGNECILSLPSKLENNEVMESIDCHRQLNMLEELPMTIAFLTPTVGPTNFKPNPYKPKGTNIYKDIDTSIMIPGYINEDFFINITTKWPSYNNVAINELQDEQRNDINITISAAQPTNKEFEIDIETWTDPPAYVPPAGWKGPEYYDIYITVTTKA